MSAIQYFSFCNELKSMTNVTPRDAVVPIVSLDGDIVDGAFFYQACWLVKPCEDSSMVKHDSDELMIFIGSDTQDHENLNAEIELWIENDKITITDTCIIFIPKGVAHGRMVAKNISKPVIHYSCLLNCGYYNEQPAAATAPVGTYAGNKVERYEPVDGFLPPAPEGFLTRLIWLDGLKLKGAPYMEAVWFHTKTDVGPENHFHEFDEIIGFLGGDPENPGELNGDLNILIDGELIPFNKSCVVYIPRGVTHSPILVPRLEKSLIHFSGGNGGDYARKDDDNPDADIFRTSLNQAN